MSLILDALRKAERERNLGHAPTLADVTQTPPKSAPPPREQHRRVLILAAIVILLLGLSLVLWTRPDPAPVVASAQDTRDSKAEQASTASAYDDEPVPADLPEETYFTSPEDEAGPQSLDELIEPRTSPAVTVAATEEASQEIYVAPEPYEIEIPGDAAATMDIELSAEESAAAPIPAVRSLRDMPSSYRANFPDLRIEVHVHNADPSKRWFLLGGTRFIEGSEMPEGPRVVEITAEGVVFEFRGETVLYGLEQ